MVEAQNVKSADNLDNIRVVVRCRPMLCRELEDDTDWYIPLYIYNSCVEILSDKGEVSIKNPSMDEKITRETFI